MKSKKNVYICSPLRPVSIDPILRTNELIDNLKLAKDACTFAALRGCDPVAPHLFYPQFLNDNDPTERALGMELGLKAMRSCDELWIISPRISSGMSDETWINAKKAVELGFADEILFDEKPEPDKKEDEPDDPEEPEKPDQEGGDDEGDEKKETEKKPFKLDTGDALWEYSTRVMGQTILGKITATADKADTNDTPDDKTETPKPAEKGLTNTAPTVTVPDMPVIGMDGKTADGSMPYEILKQQLAFMR